MADKDGQSRLAVLIDADNAPADIAEGLLREVAKYGVASVKRAYGDWTTDNLKSWKKVLLHHSIQPIQQFGYTSGKNATDSALIIDAMDLLYTERFSGFCIVSSDSDFTPLAARIREQGLTVYGFGEKKTPAPFVSACDKFIYTHLLKTAVADEEPAQEKKPEADGPISKKKLTSFIRSAIDAGSDESGWAALSAVGSNIVRQLPQFDPRDYGHKKLRDLVAEMKDQFDLDERPHADGHSKVIYLRDKRKKSPVPEAKAR
jgi:uncharacterized LabA/DUF88 family protein